MSTGRQHFRSRPSSLNLDSKLPTPPSRSISFHGSGIGSGGGSGGCISSASQYWYRQQQQRRSQNGLRRQSSFSRRVQSSMTSPQGVLMTKLLNDGMHWNGAIYRNNANRWRDSWTLLDNPILMLGTDVKGGSGLDADDEGFYGSCCLGDYADMNDNDMITSFSNPNYGLDAVNSNNPMSSPMILSNLSSNTGRRFDDVIDNRGHHGNEQHTRIDNNSRHFTVEYDQVDASSSSVSGCSSDSDEDSAVDIPTPPPTDHRTGDTQSYDTIRRSITPSDARQPLQASCARVHCAADSQLLTPAIVTSNCNPSSADRNDGLRKSTTSNSLTANGSGNGKEKEACSPFRDVYSPDSNDSGISTDDRGRIFRRRLRGNCAVGRCDVTTGSELTPENVDGIEQRKLSRGSKSWDQPVLDIPNDSSDEILPSGWEKHTDENGAYYWHIKSGTIQREPPILLSSNTSEKLSVVDGEVERISSSKKLRGGDDGETSVVDRRRVEQQHSTGSNSCHSLDLDCSTSDETCRCCQHCPQLDGVEYEGFPIRFAVHSLGWVQMSDEDLTPERSSKAVNRCIVGLSVGKNDLNDVVGRWGDGKSLYLELDEENVTLLDTQDLCVLNVQPIQSIRIWGVGRNNGRDFAYVARDGATRKQMCHVFRCDGLARHIANALRDICKRILAERSATHRGGHVTDAETETAPGDGPQGTTPGGTSAMTGGAAAAAACRPTNLPNLTRRGTAPSETPECGSSVNGEHLTFESIYKNTSFPTPMEEPRKIVRCHYLGTTQVLRPTGVDVLNNAMDNVYTRALPEKWVYVNVAVAPSTITITEHGKADNVFAECRVRFLSFMGIAMNNVRGLPSPLIHVDVDADVDVAYAAAEASYTTRRLCAFIVHCAQDQFIAHVFHCDPSASALCKTIEAACKLRYQKCLDAGHARTSASLGCRRQAAATAATGVGSRDSKSLRGSLRQGVQSMLGNLTKGCKP